ncbi:MAG: hypothetical protein M3R69_12175, partial [Acidobacteriota bacterium]|nr:hypothetical protein [Acidobacteriota bacterium]
MYFRKNLSPVVVCLLFVTVLHSFAALAKKHPVDPASGHKNGLSLSVPAEPRDEKLWKKALEIHRKAIVIDTHNDVTTTMTNDDYDLSGPPPIPYRTS